VPVTNGDLLADIVVVGLGYIGLPTAAIFASNGHQVHGVDTSPAVLAELGQGTTHIDEPGLQELVSECLASQSLTVSAEPVQSEVFFVAVPTPLADGTSPDLTRVFAAVDAITPVLSNDAIVIIESTCPVGTTDLIAERIASMRPDLTIGSDDPTTPAVAIAYCPERVLPGRILAELTVNDRVIGGLTPRCATRATAVYAPIVTGTCHQTNARTAELVKLAENAFRDVNIAFANELGLVADQHQIDPWEAIDLANRHPRVNILSPGPGVGGHCIAVDPWFIVDQLGDHTPLIQAARQVNDGKPSRIVQLVHERAATNTIQSIACLGLAYKPDVGDCRESPSIEIVSKLAATFDVSIVEPNLAELPVGLEALTLVSLDQALTCDLVLVLVGHRQFASARDALSNHPQVIDTIGLLTTRS